MRFLFCPLASAGYVFPSIAIARALVEQGHEVAFVTGTEFQDVLAEAGLRRIPRGEKDGPSFAINLWFNPTAVAVQFRHIEYALKEFPADVIVTTVLTLGPLLAREIFKIPCAVIGYLSYLWPAADSEEEPLSPMAAMRRWRYDDMLRGLNEVRAFFKMPPLTAGPREAPFLGDLFLQRSVDAVEVDTAALPERVHLVGACLWEPPKIDPELDAWMNDVEASGDRILYVHQGRTFGRPGFWGALTEALEGRRMRLAVCTGRMDLQAEITPPEGSFVRPLVPQGAVLPRAAAAVLSGTTTLALGAVTHAVPSVMVSDGSEEPEVAGWMERAGVTLHVKARDVSPETMGRLLDEVTERAALRERAREVKGYFEQVDGPRRAAALLSRLGRDKQPVLRSMA